MHPALLSRLRHLPPPIRRRLTPARIILAVQFFRFGLVGLVGFVADAAVVYALRRWLGLYVAGLASYLVAATVTWLLNRLWTFRGQGEGHWLRQWLRFIAANGLGFLLNRGAYVLLIATVPFCVAYPVVAVFAGAVAGMVSNFSLSRRVVFR